MAVEPGEAGTAVPVREESAAELAIQEGDCQTREKPSGGSASLASLPAAPRGVRARRIRRPFEESEILDWADAFYKREGKWPRIDSGPIGEAPGESWGIVNSALWHGKRGFAGGSSLARFLGERRGVKHRGHRPRLSVPQILAWCDSYRKRNDRWPAAACGRVAESPDETWKGISAALCRGTRGLPGGSSLPKLLARERGVPRVRDLGRYSVDEILRWADAFHARLRRWPTCAAGPIPEAPGETWRRVHDALYGGRRGLPGGSSLARLLTEKRGARKIRHLPPLSVPQILDWADAHHARTGEWPNQSSGPIPEMPGESWTRVQNAVYIGMRGLPGGTSVRRLLAEHRGIKIRTRMTRLTIPQILAWVDAFHGRTGRWPTADSGPVDECPDERWGAISKALSHGSRGLRGGSSLARLIARERGAKIARARRAQSSRKRAKTLWERLGPSCSRFST